MEIGNHNLWCAISESATELLENNKLNVGTQWSMLLGDRKDFWEVLSKRKFLSSILLDSMHWTCAPQMRFIICNSEYRLDASRRELHIKGRYINQRGLWSSDRSSLDVEVQQLFANFMIWSSYCKVHKFGGGSMRFNGVLNSKFKL